VVAGDRVLIGTNNERPRDPRRVGDRGVMMCLDAKDGRLLWQLVVPKLTNSIYWDWPRSGLCSPATVEGDRVWVVSSRGEVMCLDLRGLANGNDGPFLDEGRHATPADQGVVDAGPLDADILWLYDVPRELGVRQHDAACGSILIEGRELYVNTSNGLDDPHEAMPAPDAPSLIALDKDTGRLLARDGERMGERTFHCAWSSPALGEVDGRPLIIFGGGDGVVYAFEALAGARPQGGPATLRRVWQFDCDPDAPKENIHSYKNNRKEGPSNIMATPVFHGGRVYVSAGGDLWWGKNEAWIKCIDAAGTGDVTRTAGIWSRALARHGMSTAAVADGLVYVADCGGFVRCIDAATGEECWAHEAGGEIWASTLVADGKVYIGTRRGKFITLARAARSACWAKSRWTRRSQPAPSPPTVCSTSQRRRPFLQSIKGILTMTDSAACQKRGISRRGFLTTAGVAWAGVAIVPARVLDGKDRRRPAAG